MKDVQTIVQHVPYLVWRSAAWQQLATSFGSWRSVVLAEALARHPRQTLAGYERYLPTFTPTALERELDALVERELFASERGKYWATPAYQAQREAWHAASRHVMLHWHADDCLTIARAAETVCAAIDLEQLPTHQRYAYGVRPQPDAEPPLRVLLACWAWHNYHADVQLGAWREVRITPHTAIMLRELARADGALPPHQLQQRTMFNLGAGWADAVGQAAESTWIQHDHHGWRLTATGWNLWNESREVLAELLAPLLAHAADQQAACHAAFIRIQRRTPTKPTNRAPRIT